MHGLFSWGSMQTHWSFDSVFYHIYPLGLCGAPAHNDFSAPPQPRLEQLHAWIRYLAGLGFNAVYLGPLFESTAHGYDTADYYHVDRRLGARDTLARLVAELHANGIRVILDGVFNHVGRDFWAFRDVLAKGASSPYAGWFQGLNFAGRSPHGDPFTYETWEGHYDLVKLNLHNPDTRHHLLEAVRHWIQDYDIDGLRLDVASNLGLDFQKELARFTRSLRPGFWLLGEVIHGNYRYWANPETLDAVTNYEGYKGLYSSLVSKNYFEMAHTLNRQFGESGLYRGLPLYNFVDNHDVDRVASILKDPMHLYPLYALLFTMPGVPSIYYGSEWGLEGKRSSQSDAALRPQLDLDRLRQTAPHPNLPPTLRKLIQIRKASPALRCGDYRQLHVSHEQLAFTRQLADETVVVLLNSSSNSVSLELPVNLADECQLHDLFNGQQRYEVSKGRLRVDPVYPYWAHVLSTSHST
jgi:cyclomaltodextrinase